MNEKYMIFFIGGPITLVIIILILMNGSLFIEKEIKISKIDFDMPGNSYQNLSYIHPNLPLISSKLGIIDSEDLGYIMYPLFSIVTIKEGGFYKIRYFCDSNDIRIIAEISEIKNETPSVLNQRYFCNSTLEKCN